MEVKSIYITDLSIEYVTVLFEQKPISSYFLEVKTNEGISGFYGPIRQATIGVLLGTMREAIVGLNPIANEQIWNRVWGMQFGGRTGLWMMALGALDCALWDIKGKFFRVPVYELLGGPCREEVPCYASCLGFDEDADFVRNIVKQMNAEGFIGQKWALRKKRFGSDSVQQNIHSAKQICESNSGDPVMFEVMGGWSLFQAKEFCREMQDYPIRWIEEPVPSEMLPQCFPILKQYQIPLAAGEHTYHRYEAILLLQDQLVDFFQPDIGWCGGITEGFRLIALSSAFGIPVVPHGHNFLPSLHLAFAHSDMTVPMLEYHVTLEPRRQCFYENPITPMNGYIQAPEEPGLGTEITSNLLERKRLVEPDASV